MKTTLCSIASHRSTDKMAVLWPLNSGMVEKFEISNGFASLALVPRQCFGGKLCYGGQHEMNV